MNVGDRVKPVCERSECRGLTGIVLAVRENNFYTHQVKWDQREKPVWMSIRGLETL